MKSNVCRIENGTKDLEAILKESERVAEYCGLTHKQTLQLRLICEEIDGMLPNIIDDFEGNIWIELENGECKVRVSVNVPDLNIDNKDELIAVAKNQKNAAAVGIVGKIRNAIENFFLIENSIDAVNAPLRAFYMASGYSDGMDYSYYWSLDQYRTTVTKEETPEEWDELEKSVIAAVADDIIVGVKGKQADITVVKKFA